MKMIMLTVAVCIGLCATYSSASVMKLSVEIVDFSNGYVLADGSILPGTEHIGSIWKTVNVTTYRFWVSVCTSADIVFRAGSGPSGMPLELYSSSGNFINDIGFGSNSPPNANLIGLFPWLAWDSFVTIGGATAQTLPDGFMFKFENELGGISSTIFVDHVHWSIARIPGAGVVSDGQGGWRVLIAQLSVPHFNMAIVSINAQGFNGLNEYLTMPLGGIPDSCLADIAPACGDRIVDFIDLVTVLDQFGPCDACPADITPPGGNNEVNIDDLVTILSNFGPCPF